MKRTISLWISVFLLLTLLSACQQQTPELEQQAESPEVQLPALDLARAISAANADEPKDSLSELTGDDLTAYMEAAYGLESGAWEDVAVIQATDVLAYEIAVVRFADEKQAEQGEEALTEYRSARAGAFGGYAPEQAALAESGHVSRQGRYVGLFICEDPEEAEGLFFSALETGELPEPVETPEPEPTSAPEPELAEDMQAYCDAFLTLCHDDIEALGGYTITTFQDEGFAQMLESTYGIPASFVTDGFLIDDLGDNMFQILVLHTPGRTGSIQGYEALIAYRDNILASIPYEEEEDGTQVFATSKDFSDYSLASSGSIFGGSYNEGTEWNRYIGLVFSNVVSWMDGYDRYMRIYMIEDTLSRPALPATALACDVTFLDVTGTWTAPTGEPDPDYPGRLLFTQPNKEDMTPYDTSAITAAWAARDPGGLGEQDRAVYDAAKAVLEEVLTEGMSDYEKEVVLYEWIIQNVDYDWSHTDALSETSRASSTPYGGLVNHSAICLGYASTFQLLMDLAGVECVTVTGASRESGHAWNLVRLDGAWYCVDATWDATNYSSYTGAREWRFFNTTSDYMARTGHQWDYRNVPEAVSETHGSVR